MELRFSLLGWRLFAVILGAALGSFMDCVAWRDAHDEKILNGGSHCADCGHTLSAGDLIPIISFLSHHGRCRYCGGRIPLESLVAEVAGAFLFYGFSVKFYASNFLAMWLLFGALLLLLGLIDHASRHLPGEALTALAVNRMFFWWLYSRSMRELGRMIVGACSVSIPLLFLVWLVNWVTGKENMGKGDLKLVFVIGLYLDWVRMLLLLLVACMIGITEGLLLKRTVSGERLQGLPFGSYLAIAAVFVILFGEPIVEWYVNL